MISFSHTYYHLLGFDDKHLLKNSHGPTLQLKFLVRIVMEFELIDETGGALR